MKYDVFISSKSNDYAIAEEVSAFLKEKGLKVFFSKRSIDEEGHSLYQKVIADAIRDSANMIVVCSNANHVRDDRGAEGSKWVYYEWATFHQMILDNEKPDGADIVTIYTPTTDLKQLPRRLRNRQCIPYDEYKDRIMRYMDDNVKAQGNDEEISLSMTFGGMADDSDTGVKRPIARKLLVPLLSALAGLLLGLGIFSAYRHFFSSEKMLVLAGGGSVVTFLDDKYRGVFNKDTTVNVFGDNKYPNAFYLHMPSEVALTLLSEEAIMPYSRVNQPFYPVCLSAEKAVDTLFLTKCTDAQMKDAGYIAEYLLGEEALALYVESSVPGLDTVVDSTNNVISVDQLIQLLHLDGCSIFSTSQQSGTYHAYYGVLKPKSCDLSTIPFEQFSSQTPLKMLQSPNGIRKPFIIMGGNLYRPEEALKDLIENKTVRKLMLVDDNGKTVGRPMYLYFLAYKEEINGKEKYIVPAEVLKLLINLGFENKKELINKNNELTVTETDKLIVPIE